MFMKNFITICTFVFAFGVLTTSAQNKKELAAKITTLEKKLQEKEHDLLISKEREIILNQKIEMATTEVSDAREENTKLLNTINNFASLSQQRVQNLTIGLETIKQKDAQLKIVNDALAKAEEEKIKQLNIFKEGLSGIGKVNFQNGILTITISNAELYGDTKTITLTEKGQAQVKKIGELLAKNLEYDIIIEGNSNELDFEENKLFRDNWDLSALQASTIAKQLLTESKIEPKRIETSAKGKYNTQAVETYTRIMVKSNYASFFNTIMEGMKK